MLTVLHFNKLHTNERNEPSGLRRDFNPFEKSNYDIPLRFTLHLSSFANCSEKDKKNLEALKGYICHSQFRGISTDNCEIPFMVINSTISVSDFDVQIIVPDDFFSVNDYSNWKAHININSFEEKSPISISDYLRLAAHISMGQDIFITLSSSLLKSAKTYPFNETNILTPSEALKVIGVFLRSRGLFNLSNRISTDRTTFYLTSAYVKMPALQLFIKKCELSQSEGLCEIIQLTMSVQIRCSRVLETLDFIGEQNYLHQDNNTSELLNFYFDYLFLLLNGALDALARIIFRIYKINNPSDEHKVDFSNKEFKESLFQKDNYLYKFIFDDQNRNLLQTLSILRNKIHGSVPQSSSITSSDQPRKSYISFPKKELEQIKSLKNTSINLMEYGIIKESDVFFIEPYTFSIRFSNLIFSYIDGIITRINIDGLFNSHSEILKSFLSNYKILFTEDCYKQVSMIIW
jgi:hypothetical protein